VNEKYTLISNEDFNRWKKTGFDSHAAVPLYTLEQMKTYAAERVAAEIEACAKRGADFLGAVRFSSNHLGLGDIRLTIGQQEDLLDAICDKEKRNE